MNNGYSSELIYINGVVVITLKIYQILKFKTAEEKNCTKNGVFQFAE